LPYRLLWLLRRGQLFMRRRWRPRASPTVGGRSRAARADNGLLLALLDSLALRSTGLPFLQTQISMWDPYTKLFTMQTGVRRVEQMNCRG
jgi:hypothetical protein